MNEEYTIHHFSLSLPNAEGKDNVPNLLKHLAETIEQMENDIEIQDIVFHNDEDAEGNNWPVFTVYYYKKQ